MRCEYCGAIPHEGDKFCRGCGAKLPDPPQKTTIGFCRRCGQRLTESDQICPFCHAVVAKSYPVPQSYSLPDDDAPNEKRGLAPAIIALLLSFIPFVGLIPAMILGIVGIVSGGKTKCVGAVVCGAIAVAVSVFMIVLPLVVLFSSPSYVGEYDYFFATIGQIL